MHYFSTCNKIDYSDQSILLRSITWTPTGNSKLGTVISCHRRTHVNLGVWQAFFFAYISVLCPLLVVNHCKKCNVILLKSRKKKGNGNYFSYPLSFPNFVSYIYYLNGYLCKRQMQEEAKLFLSNILSTHWVFLSDLDCLFNSVLTTYYHVVLCQCSPISFTLLWSV